MNFFFLQLLVIYYFYINMYNLFFLKKNIFKIGRAGCTTNEELITGGAECKYHKIINIFNILYKNY